MLCVTLEAVHERRTLAANSSTSSPTSTFSAVANEIRPSGFVSESYVALSAKRHGMESWLALDWPREESMLEFYEE
jgi:hypothetical protein